MTTDTELEISPDPPLRKYYTPKMVQVGTFLGGPMAAGYYIRENYRSFGEAQKSLATWLYSIFATTILLVVIIIIPDNYNQRGSQFLIPLIISLATFSLVKYLQSNMIKKHVDAGGVSYGWGRTIVISLIGAAVTFAYIFVIGIILIFLFPSLGE